MLRCSAQLLQVSGLEMISITARRLSELRLRSLEIFQQSDNWQLLTDSSAQQLDQSDQDLIR